MEAFTSDYGRATKTWKHVSSNGQSESNEGLKFSDPQVVLKPNGTLDSGRLVYKGLDQLSSYRDRPIR